METNSTQRRGRKKSGQRGLVKDACVRGSEFGGFLTAEPDAWTCMSSAKYIYIYICERR